jgi:hypothetical protein
MALGLMLDLHLHTGLGLDLLGAHRSVVQVQVLVSV